MASCSLVANATQLCGFNGFRVYLVKVQVDLSTVGVTWWWKPGNVQRWSGTRADLLPHTHTHTQWWLVNGDAEFETGKCFPPSFPAFRDLHSLPLLPFHLLLLLLLSPPLSCHLSLRLVYLSSFLCCLSPLLVCLTFYDCSSSFLFPPSIIPEDRVPTHI